MGQKFALVAGFVLAIVFMFGCSSGDNGREDCNYLFGNTTCKSMCGSSEYNTSTQFCHGNVIYSKCGSSSYNPNKEFCSDRSVYQKCNGHDYSPGWQVCKNGNIVDVCGGIEYNKATHFCFNNNSNNQIIEKCGNGGFYNEGSYDPNYQRCENGVVLSKCANEWYNEKTHFCYSEQIIEKCGNGSYNPSYQTCADGVVLIKCGEDYYNPETETERCCGNNIYTIATHLCYNEKIYEINCGTSGSYNPSNQKCADGVVLDFCGGEDYYNPATEGCCNNNKYTMATEGCCGKNKYTKATHFCYYRDTIVENCGDNSFYDPSSNGCCGTSLYSLSYQKCADGVLLYKCGIGENYYDPATHFCYNDYMINEKCGIYSGYDPSIYGCCGTSPYTLSNETCIDGVILGKCGTDSYDPATHFCNGEEIYERCGVFNYDPSFEGCCGTNPYPYVLSNQKCEDGVILDKCRDDYYNPAMYFCYNDSRIGIICGNNRSYNPSSSGCCGTTLYTILTQTCVDGVIVPR